ncbi:MAG TPA: hypothetical protein VKY74_25680 [Chloroflexia bacterium]|nr:hypothetical protein [Chloroflexia bacterium]
MSFRLTDLTLSRPLRLLIAALIGLSTALFVLGVTVERAHEGAAAGLGPEGDPAREAAEHPAPPAPATTVIPHPIDASPTAGAPSATPRPATAVVPRAAVPTLTATAPPATRLPAIASVRPEGDATREAAEHPATRPLATATIRPEGDATREAGEHPATRPPATATIPPEGDATREAAERPATAQPATATIRPEGDATREAAEHPATRPPATATIRPEGDATREAAERPATAQPATATIRPEGDATREAAEHPATPSPPVAPGGSTVPPGVPSEHLFGLDLENPAVVFAVVLGWLGLGLALFFGGRPILMLISIAAGLTTLFDLGEVGHQLALGDEWVAALAIAVTVAHGALLGVVLFALTRRAHSPAPGR